MSWIQTLDGQAFSFYDPSPRVIEPQTLATVLSRICRFGGHCREFYSVAQHSLLVEALVDHPQLKLPALLHDAHEAYWGFGDICRPAVDMLGAVGCDMLQRHKRAVDVAIAERFGFSAVTFYDPEIKHADNVALATEARDLMQEHPREWAPLPDPIEHTTVFPLPPESAARLFLERLQELCQET